MIPSFQNRAWKNLQGKEDNTLFSILDYTQQTESQHVEHQREARHRRYVFQKVAGLDVLGASQDKVTKAGVNERQTVCKRRFAACENGKMN